MVKEALVILVIDGRLPLESRADGRKLLDRLDAMNLNIQAAYWEFVEEDNTWRLCLATPLADTKGPLYVYSLLGNALREMLTKERSDLELADIAVISPQMRMVADLQRQYGVVDHEDSHRVRRSDGPYIYRLRTA